MKPSAVRAVAAVLIGVLATLSLSGCDTFLPDPVAFTSIDSQPVVRICIPLTVSDVQIRTYRGEDDHTGEVVWEATGSAFLEAGAEFVLNQPMDGFHVVTDAHADYLNESRMVVQMEVSSAKGGDWQTYSPLQGSQFLDDVWLDGYGTPQDVPCMRGDCGPMSACFNEWPIPTGYATDPESTFVPTSVPTVQP